MYQVAVCLFTLSLSSTHTTDMPSQASLVPVSLPLVPHAGPTAQTTRQRPRATSILNLLQSQKRILHLSHVDSEGPGVAQDILHFNALSEAGTASIPGIPVYRHQYTRKFRLAAIT